MSTIPKVLILLDSFKNDVVILECLKLKIVLITIVDTNCNPRFTDLFIPLNDNSVGVFYYFLKYLDFFLNFCFCCEFLSFIIFWL